MKHPINTRANELQVRDRLFGAIDFHAGEQNVPTTTECGLSRPDFVVADGLTNKRYRVTVEEI